MVQEVLAYIIIALVFLFLVRSAFQTFKAKDQKGNSPCSGCTGCDVKPKSTPRKE